MLKQHNTLRPWGMKAILIFPLIAFAGFTLAQGTLIWSIVGAVAAGLAAIFGGYFVGKDWFQTRRLKCPFHVTYLIPKREYPEVLFEGAPEEEKTPETLTVGVGNYRIMHLIHPKTEVTVDPIVLRFEGPLPHCPKPGGRDNPFIVDEVPGHRGQDSTQVIDWWGDFHPSSATWPRHYVPGEPQTFGNRARTFGPWIGKLSLTFPVHGGTTVKVVLPFHVTDVEASDEIPFLKGDRDNYGKTKERAAWEAAHQEGISAHSSEGSDKSSPA